MSSKQKKIQFKARIKLNNDVLASNLQAQPRKKRCRGYVESSPLTGGNEMAARIEVGISHLVTDN